MPDLHSMRSSFHPSFVRFGQDESDKKSKKHPILDRFEHVHGPNCQHSHDKPPADHFISLPSLDPPQASDHVHGPGCNHNHEHDHPPEASARSQAKNPLVRMVLNTLLWFKEFFTSFFQDLRLLLK